MSKNLVLAHTTAFLYLRMLIFLTQLEQTVKEKLYKSEVILLILESLIKLFLVVVYNKKLAVGRNMVLFMKNHLYGYLKQWTLQQVLHSLLLVKQYLKQSERLI